MQFEIVPLIDATTKKFYGVIVGKAPGCPASIIHQSEPIYSTSQECMDDMQAQLEEVAQQVGLPKPEQS